MSDLSPIRRSVSVSWDQAAAFRRFTHEFSSWWPWRTHSIGGTGVKRVVFECRAGGLIYEEHVDGRRFQWGCVLEFEAPRRVKFTWHPSRDASTAQHVEVRFEPEGRGTRVELISDHWENWGKGAPRARRGYDVGWGYVLNVWAERRNGKMALLDALAVVFRGVEIVRGGRRASIARAGGEMPRATADVAH